MVPSTPMASAKATLKVKGHQYKNKRVFLLSWLRAIENNVEVEMLNGR
jgi:hypothetical protein